jgi:hypothetical protein
MKDSETERGDSIKQILCNNKYDTATVNKIANQKHGNRTTMQEVQCAN